MSDPGLPSSLKGDHPVRSAPVTGPSYAYRHGISVLESCRESTGFSQLQSLRSTFARTATSISQSSRARLRRRPAKVCLPRPAFAPDLGTHLDRCLLRAAEYYYDGVPMKPAAGTCSTAFSTAALITAAVAGFSALGRWPYTYYGVLRLIVFAGSAWGAYDAARHRRITPAVLLGVLTIIFNPLVPLRLQPTQWRPLGVVAALVCVACAFYASRPLPVVAKPASPQLTVEPPFGAFGDQLNVATATHFFRWFQLAPVYEKPTSHRTKRYRPSGPAFHNLVSFEIGMDTEERIARMTLELDRSFIDDARNGAFAADIASSLLENATGSRDRPQVGALIVALKNVMLDRSSVMMRGDRHPPAEPLGKLAPALDVYRGLKGHSISRCPVR